MAVKIKEEIDIVPHKGPQAISQLWKTMLQKHRPTPAKRPHGKKAQSAKKPKSHDYSRNKRKDNPQSDDGEEREKERIATSQLITETHGIYSISGEKNADIVQNIN